jgi:hypothetical protein
MHDAQQQSQEWDRGGENAKLCRAMLDAWANGLRGELDQEPKSPVPPTLSRLIEKLKQAEASRNPNTA